MKTGFNTAKMHLQCFGSFTKHCELIQKFKETNDFNHIYKSELDKSYSAHDAAYFDSKDLVKRAISDKILKDRVYKIARNPKHNGYQRGLASMVYNFFDEKTGWRLNINEQLVQE